MINYLGISGGKDSTAALLWLRYESGYPPDSLRVVFCDTGNEHELTYQYIAMLSETVFPIVTLKPQLDFYELARKKKRFPSAKVRFCTQELKMYPTQADVKAIMDQGETVLLHSGVRAEESPDRAQLPEREWDLFFATNVYRPLLHWKISDVWSMLAKYGVPRNPLYDYGARRVGCFPCVMSSKREFRTIAEHFPERIDLIRQAELEFARETKGFTSFVSYDKVPPTFRSKSVAYDGKSYQVPTIDDVVLWSHTHRGGKQYEMDLDEPSTCSSVLGQCE